MKNILLIVVDTLRPDHLGCYGYERPTSPSLDALAARSLVLDSLWSASNFTAPAFTSLFTGLYPHQHGVFDFRSQAPSSPIHELLRQNRADLGGVVSFRFFGNLLRNVWGDIEAVTDTRSFDYSKELPRAVTESALTWLSARDSSAPFCLFCHYVGPHLPFRLPHEFASSFATVPSANVDPEFVRQFFPQEEERLESRVNPEQDSMFKLLEDINWGRRSVSPDALQWLRDKYDASVLYNDRAIGELFAGLERLGHAADTVVAVLSDHGEEFLEHGGISHGGIHMHEEIIRTVGIIYDPSGSPRRIARPVSQVDVLSTLCCLAGADSVPGSWQAQRVDSEGTEDTPPPPVFCHGKSKIAMRSGDRKYIRTAPSRTVGLVARCRIWAKMALRRELGSEIYDLAKDPSEQTNLIRDRKLRRNLDRLLAAHLADDSGRLQAIDADEAERLRIEREMKDLGYM